MTDILSLFTQNHRGQNVNSRRTGAFCNHATFAVMSLTWIIKLYYPSMFFTRLEECSTWDNLPWILQCLHFSNTVKNLHVISCSRANPRDIFAFTQYLKIRDFFFKEIIFFFFLREVNYLLHQHVRKTIPVSLGSYTTIAMALPKIHEVTLPDKHISNSIFCSSLIFYLWGQVCAWWTTPSHYSVPFLFKFWGQAVCDSMLKNIILKTKKKTKSFALVPERNLQWSLVTWGLQSIPEVDCQFKVNSARIEVSSYRYVAILKTTLAQKEPD